MMGEGLSLETSSWNAGISLGRVLEKKKKKTKVKELLVIISDRFTVKASFPFILIMSLSSL